MYARTGRLILVIASSSIADCSGGAAGPPFPVELSNGVTFMDGTDADAVTTLGDGCVIAGWSGLIECPDRVVRPKGDGVQQGLGWVLIDPSQPTCAGSSAPAPQIAVFSFGSLIIEPGAQVQLRGKYAVALVAYRQMTIQGALLPNRRAMLGEAWAIGGFPGGTIDYPGQSFGPSPGEDRSPASWAGPGGAGAATAGGSGGDMGANLGAAGGAAVASQVEPLCGGSGGGSMYDAELHYQKETGAWGGAALLLAAGESIELSGQDGCGVFADGQSGYTSDPTGAGGAAGGTISVETPSLEVGGDCRISAIGGAGGAGGFGGPDGAPGGSPGDGGSAPGAGGDGTFDVSGAGGGGGAAGFIRVRTSACPVASTAIVPPPACDSLP